MDWSTGFAWAVGGASGYGDWGPSTGTRHFRLKGLIYWHPPQLQPVQPWTQGGSGSKDVTPGQGPRPIQLTFIFLIFVLYWSNTDIQCCVSSQHTSQPGSVIHMHISILLQILFPHILLQCVEWSSVCYTNGLVDLLLCVNFSLLIYASLLTPPCPLGAVCFFMSVILSLFCKWVHMCIDSEVAGDSDTIAILSFLVWLPSLRMIIARSTHVAGIGIFFTLFYSQREYSTVYMYHFFICSSLDGDSHCFTLGFASSAPVNIYVHLPIPVMVFVSIWA